MSDFIEEFKQETEDDYSYTKTLRWNKICQEIPPGMPIIDTLTEYQYKLKMEENQ